MIFVLMQIQKTCREEYTSLYAAFIDLTKAFDTVNHDGLLKILARFGCPPKFLTILRQFHEGQQGQVKHSGSLSGSFPISNGVQQGCVMAPTLLSIVFCIMRQRGPARRSLHPFPNRLQPLQPSASPCTYKNHPETHH